MAASIATLTYTPMNEKNVNWKCGDRAVGFWSSESLRREASVIQVLQDPSVENITVPFNLLMSPDMPEDQLKELRTSGLDKSIDQSFSPNVNSTFLIFEEQLRNRVFLRKSPEVPRSGVKNKRKQENTCPSNPIVEATENLSPTNPRLERSENTSPTSPRFVPTENTSPTSPWDEPTSLSRCTPSGETKDRWASALRRKKSASSQEREIFASKKKPVRHSCIECRSSFASGYNLKRHINSIHLGVRHTCTKCTHSFSTTSNLRRHQKRC